MSATISSFASSASTSAPAATTSASSGGGGGGPTSSPLLFFVALGFGVVFTNLWIIVGVKYCFRYNQRNRQRAMGADGTPIDLVTMPRPHRRRREKKLMSMEEVNERFPLSKYKTWRSSREAEGLPAAGGLAASNSRPASIKNEAIVLESPKHQSDITTLEIAQDHHLGSDRAGTSKQPFVVSEEKSPLERTETATSTLDQEREDSDAEDDPIRTAAPPEMLAAPGDTCAICLDTLEDDDDVRGLTCGHAYHAACLDPWLTSRRACCPLCKADYYVPKPRSPENEQEEAGRRERGMRLPQTPASAWIGGGGRGMIPGRPRMLTLGGPRFLMMEPRADTDVASRSRQDDRARAMDPNQTHGWRSRLPHMPNLLGRRNANSLTGDASSTTPAQLEAGNSR